MGGVHHNDQMRGYYHVRMKGRKYYKYVFWFLLDVAITNSFILCKHHTDLGIRTMKDFRTNLAKGLIGDYCSRKRPGRPRTVSQPKRFCSEHFPTRGAERGHRCHYCHNHKRERHDTVWYCKECNLFLCHNGRDNDCFYLYHTRFGPTMN